MAMKMGRWLAAAGILAAVAATGAKAQTVAPSGPLEAREQQESFTLLMENDKFNGTDKWYTSGAKLILSRPAPATPAFIVSPLIAANQWIFDQPGRNRYELALGQNIYEPNDESLNPPDPRDRPYAAWAYLSATAVAENRGQQNTLEVQLGVVGPWALGKEIQDVVHTLIGSDQPKGWGSQLPNEPGLLVGLSRRWRSTPVPVVGGIGIDVVPFVGVAVGNVQTYANLGAQLRLGSALRADFGSPRVRPAGGAAIPLMRNEFGWYVFAGAEGWVVARDIFLDGSTFEDSPSVSKESVVGEWSVGFVAYVPGGRFNATYIKRSEEFSSQPNAFEYGSASLTFAF
ncbi:lipid A deacylase LpxR family protein [Zavarzinia compransoris]|uniref:DUF2219 domain-containing protein n=1 Tax=Zavarzinia compransoris TaxID=1264899 RepID=A0A317E3T3_9PROT|nr:lipid A deacylase LpxR family protein [Zavarzinia compransoris]PWR19725.1 DUF2219 domain-containing protein [Zavarzinia compransoris]TDP43327.1 hypothetical protein DES42_11228 [Zavarzinia compransoris]